MKKEYKIALLAAISVLFIIGFLPNNKAEEKVTAQQVINKMLENYGKIQTYQDKGIIEIKTGGMKTTGETDFLYKSPDKFCIFGYGQKIISDGKKIWVYSEPSNQYIESETNEIIMEMAERASPIFGVIKEGKEFLTDGWDKETKNWVLSNDKINQKEVYLIEVSLAENKGKQRFWVSKDRLTIERMETSLKGEGAGETLITQTFQDIIVNEPITDKNFFFSPPAGAKKETSPFAEQKSEWLGKRSLDFTLSTIEGKPVKLSDYRGKTIVLNFWSSDCIPCLEELEILEKIYQDYKSKNLTLFGVNSEYNEYRIRKTVKEKGITFPILHDKEEEIAAFYEINAVPRLIIIDKEGIIRGDYTGALPESRIREELGKLGIK